MNPEPYRRPDDVPADSAIGMPNFTSDEIHGRDRTDWAAGQKFTSKADRKAYYKEHDMKRVTIGEAQDLGVTQDHPSTTKTHVIPGVRKTHRKLKWWEQVQ